MPGGSITPIFGRPGFPASTSVAQRRNVSRNGALDYYPAGGVIKGSMARDVNNASANTKNLRAGLLMGKITSGGYYANSIVGLSQGALTATGTTLSSTANIAAEISRRIGATGTFKLTGPPTASGVVRTVVVTYSALNLTSGDITITAVGVNEVQTVAYGATMTAGFITLGAYKTDGTFQVARTAFDTNWSTTVSDLQTAINALLGTSAVALAVTNTHDMTVTFSGTGYTNLPQPLVTSEIAGATSTTTGSVTRTTAGVDGRFVTKSLIQPTDGSENIRTMIGDGYGYPIQTIGTTDQDINFPLIPISGTVDPAQILDWPADTSLQAYIESQLKQYGVWVFGDQF